MPEKSSQSQFDAYEYISVIAPGAVLSLGVILLWPATKEMFFSSNVSVGELGLFLIIAYVAGHLLQSVGNAIEKALWKCFGGMPTDWVLNEKQTLISAQQRIKLQSIIQHTQNVPVLENLNAGQWYSVVREMYIDIEKAGRANRIDSFNRTYGLLRGIASAFLVLGIIILLHTPAHWDATLWVLALGFLPSLFRMFRFGRSYGRELLLEYINHHSSNPSNAAKPPVI